MEKFEYAPAPESAALVDIKSQYGLLSMENSLPQKVGKLSQQLIPLPKKFWQRLPMPNLRM
jgi:hypothetical protein